MPTIILTKKYSKKAVKFFKSHKNLFPKYKKTLFLLEKDPFHTSIRLHKLKGKFSEYYSISLSFQYRIMLDFIIENDNIILIDIGGHELYEF